MIWWINLLGQKFLKHESKLSYEILFIYCRAAIWTSMAEWCHFKIINQLILEKRLKKQIWKKIKFEGFQISEIKCRYSFL